MLIDYLPHQNYLYLCHVNFRNAISHIEPIITFTSIFDRRVYLFIPGLSTNPGLS
jgi:hypothetical protein